jgi:hypothetical protein
VRPLCLCNGAFDGYMVYLSIIVLALSLGLEIGVGTSSNCKECAMGWECFTLSMRFLILWRRLWWWIDFIFLFEGYCFALDR